MDAQALQEAIAEAKQAEASRIAGLRAALESVEAIEAHYSGIGLRATNKVHTQAVKAREAITAILEAIS